MASSAENHQSSFQAALFALSLDRGAGLQAQLTAALRALILKGHHGGARLPSSRALAQELSVSRLTVTTAYDQLTAEGYLTARQGAGTFVAEDLPHLSPPPPARPAPPPQVPPLVPFHPGLPDQRPFPHRAWARALDRAWGRPDPGLLGRPDVLGWRPLRQAIAAHLKAWRGLDCDAGQVVITSGARDVTELLALALLPPAAEIALEDPGWPATFAQLTQLGARPRPIRIGPEGLDPAAIPTGVQAVMVTPSRHYPTGAVLPMPQRMGLLAWAQRTGGLVLEDDYDGEFRYRGQPLPALAGLDGLTHVLYAGSFSKLMSPGLRLGYLVLPERLVAPVVDHLARGGLRASLTPQPALAAFMESGDFATHLRRMRRLYAARQAALLEGLQPVADLLELQPDAAGMHLLAPLRRRFASDVALARSAQAAGVSVKPLSGHAVLPDPPEGLILGYTAFDTTEIAAAASRLCSVLRVASAADLPGG